MKKYLALLLLVPFVLVGCTATDPVESVDDPNTSEFSNVVPEENEGGGSFIPTYRSITTDPEAWQHYADAGSTLPSEDPEIRTITVEEFNSSEDPDTSMRVAGDITADAEITALNVTGWVKDNMESSIEDIPEDLIVNRYPTLVEVEFFPVDSGEVSIYFQSTSGAMVGGFAQTTVFAE